MGVLKIPRATTAERAGLTLALGELVYDVDTDTVWAGDGSTVGGVEIGGGGGDVDGGSSSAAGDEIAIRRDTSTNWTANNPTPRAGELCVETDTRLFKIGNGSTAYNSLSYTNAIPASTLSHASSHQHAGSDEIATATPAANAIPKAGAGGTLAIGWIQDASTSQKGVVQLATSGSATAGRAVEATDSRLSNARTPSAHASSHQHGGSDEIATTTAGANAIPKAGAGGTLAPGWLPSFSASEKGAVNASGGGTTNFLRADGTWAAPPGGGLPDGLKGDIIYHDGADWVVLPPTTDGDILTLQSDVPAWLTPSPALSPALPWVI